MFNFFRQLVRPVKHATSFSDGMLGDFRFHKGLGWLGSVCIEEYAVEVVLGSDGELPSTEMLNTAGTWVRNWDLRRSAMMQFIQSAIASDEWSEEPDIPAPQVLFPKSLNVLWEDRPNVCIIYLEAPGDERAWHITYTGDLPTCFAYDH